RKASRCQKIDRKKKRTRGPAGRPTSHRSPRPAPPAGGEEAGKASLLLEFLPLARQYPFPLRHQGEGLIPLPDVAPVHTTADSQPSSHRCCTDLTPLRR